MIKNILISSAAVFMLAGCIPTSQLTNVASSMSSLTGNKALTAASTVQSATTKDNSATGCIPRMSGGSTSFTQMITQKIVTLAIESALEKVSGNANVQVPTKIMDTCTADKRLAYLQKLTKDFSKNIDNANKDILASVEQTKEVQKLQAQIDHKKKTLDEAEYNEGVTQDNEEMLKLIKDAKIIDKEKYSAAMGKLAISTPLNGYMILGWDKEILEFAKDNMLWGIQNVGAVKDVASQLTTTIKVLPTLASLTTSPLYNGRVDEDIAKKAGEAQIKTDKEIAEKVAQDNGFED